MLIRAAEIVEIGDPSGSEAGTGSRAAAVRLLGSRIADVRISGDRIAAIAAQLDPAPGERVIAAHGGALLPGLHDHHMHLLALAASESSLRCGPPAVRDREALRRALSEAKPNIQGWIRGVGYHESVAGRLDRTALDALAPGRRVRIQHRSGALWILSSPALAAVGLDGPQTVRDAGPGGAEGIECDARGRPTGRLFRLDAWLRGRLPSPPAPALGETSRRLAEAGICGLTDATPTNDATTLALFRAAQDRRELLQHVVLMGDRTLPRADAATLERGARKLVLDERSLPEFAALVDEISAAHGAGRAVAIHCVTRSELVLATAALAETGTQPGDRIEHASVAPDELAEQLATLGVSVVTQPGFVYERGDAYLRDVDRADRVLLYRCAGFDRQGVALGGGTDAPYGEPDPWIAMQAAVDRRTEAGAVLGPAEAVSPERALALFTSNAREPGGAVRRIAPGILADLVLLDRPWERAREKLERRAVAATLCRGALVYQREADPKDD